MIKKADFGALFRAPHQIIDEHKQLPHNDDYCELDKIIDKFLAN